MDLLLAVTLSTLLPLVSPPVSCKTAIQDPPTSPRHTLTAEQRELVLQRIAAEIPLQASGPREQPWMYKFTDVVTHEGVATVTFTISDPEAGVQYPEQRCVSYWARTVRALIYDRNDECRLDKGFRVAIMECLDKYESGTTLLAGKPVPIPK